MLDNTISDMQAREWLNTLAFVAENMRGLGHAISDDDVVQFKRISQICTACMVGDEWATFRKLTPQQRAHFVNEWMIDSRVPRLVRERFDNAVRDWFTGSPIPKQEVAVDN
jgi:hypothetical protein